MSENVRSAEKSRKSISINVDIILKKNSLCNGAIDVRNNDLVVVLPPEQIAFASRRPLIRRRYTEHHLVHAIFQIQTVDLVRSQS